jgi:beta-lactamase regulating signal transducer with metallopeptidase domain
MQDLIIYFVKANITFSLLFIIYWLLLRNEKFFVLNRIILLGIILISLLLPLLPFKSFPNTGNKVLETFHQRLSEVPLIQKMASIDNQQISIDNRSNSGQHLQATDSGYSLLQMGIAVYLLIAFIFFVRFVFQILQLFRLLKGNETKTIDGIVYHITEKQLPPFSFFQHLVINKSDIETAQIEQIIIHEKTHIKQWHMIDILLSEFIQMIFWINPFAWFLKRSVKLNLEYIADERVLKNGFDRQNYQINILTACLNSVELKFANLFTSSKIKLRIKMMNTKNSPLSHLYKYALVLPVIITAYFLMNPVKTHASNKNGQQQLYRSWDENKRIKETNAGPDSNLLQEGTPLILAVRRGNLEAAKALLAAGADINLPSPGDGNPLITACMYGHEQIALFLIDKGADVNMLVEGDETPLINACRNGNLRIVQYLVTHGANLNLSVMANPAKRPELRSPLNQAIRYKHAAIEAYLREKGAKE